MNTTAQQNHPKRRLAAIRSMVQSLAQSWLDIVSPECCVACYRVFRSSEQRANNYLCQTCSDTFIAAPSPDELKNDFIEHFPGDLCAVTNVYSRYALEIQHDSGLLQVIHKLKYEGFYRVAEEMGYELGTLLDYLGAVGYDALVPVPIHNARKRERGYNQAEHIAIGVERVVKIPVAKSLVVRTRYTSTQTKLSKEERIKNITDAFTSGKDAHRITNGVFLVIDDVLTTGSTLNTVAQCLLDYGARRVDVATIAKTT